MSNFMIFVSKCAKKTGEIRNQIGRYGRQVIQCKNDRLTPKEIFDKYSPKIGKGRIASILWEKTELSRTDLKEKPELKNGIDTGIKHLSRVTHTSTLSGVLL